MPASALPKAGCMALFSLSSYQRVVKEQGRKACALRPDYEIAEELYIYSIFIVTN